MGKPMEKAVKKRGVAVYLHAWEGAAITEEELRQFWQYEVIAPYRDAEVALPQSDAWFMRLYDEVGQTPNIWLGMAVWSEAERVPQALKVVQQVVGEGKVLSDEERRCIVEAFQKESRIGEQCNYAWRIAGFLHRYRRRKVFVISWPD